METLPPSETNHCKNAHGQFVKKGNTYATPVLCQLQPDHHIGKKRWEMIMIAPRVAIVLPALNEEAALRRLLAELPRHFAQWIIVVDNGSSDATAAVAQDA